MESHPSFRSLALPSTATSELLSWHVDAGARVRKGTPLCSYTSAGEEGGGGDPCQLKSSVVGVVRELLAMEGATIDPGAAVIVLEEVCDHSIVVFDMCADCGLNLRMDPSAGGSQSTVSMVHSIPEIRISQKEAHELGNKDKLRLLRSRKLALIVDLDQTLIHTSCDPNIQPGLPDVYGFNLPGHSLLYHCRLRPYAKQFLEKVSQLYEMHIFTMATNSYAATIANILDPEKKLFCDRIISRDECFDPQSKALRLRSVFPCGDEMVAIIDDREDVWKSCPNLVHVKPYVFFAGTADINAPSRSEPPQRRESVPLRREVKPLPPHRASAPPTRQHGNHSRQRPFYMPTTDLAKPPPAPSSGNPVVTTTQPPEQTSEKPVDERPPAIASDLKEDVLDSQEQLPASQTSPPTNTCTNSDTLLKNTNTHNNNNSATNSQENGDSKAGDSESSSSSSSSDTEDSSSSSGSSSSGGNEESLLDELSNDHRGPLKGECESMDAVPSKKNDTVSISTPMLDDVAKVSPDGLDEPQPPPPQQGQPPSSEREHPASSSEASGGESKTTTCKIPEIHDPDNFLLHLGNILEQLHSHFYTAYDEMNRNVDISSLLDIPTPDLKDLIPKMRKSVLKGVNILFTGVIPTNMPPERSREWNTAKAFGATLHRSLVPGLNSPDPEQARMATTHVIVGKPGTSKLREARKIPGMKVVTPRWLWTCAEQWKWNDEHQFKVKLEKTPSSLTEMTAPNTKIAKVEHSPTSDSNMDSALTSQEKNDVFTKEKIISEAQPEYEQDPFDDNGEALTTIDKATCNLNRQFHRLDSYISVSDEELEKMDAEVDAEIESSSSSSSDTNDDPALQEESEQSSLREGDCSYEHLAGGEAPPVLSRKRKRGAMEGSSSSNSPSSNLYSLEQSEDEDASCSSNDEDDDELATLLGVD